MNTQTIHVNFPKDLAFTLKMGENEFGNEMKKLAIIKLFELGRISSGMASAILGLDRIVFLDILGKYNVSIYNYADNDTLLNDIANA
jgi:predicted HTH domain antitoxin